MQTKNPNWTRFSSSCALLTHLLPLLTLFMTSSFLDLSSPLGRQHCRKAGILTNGVPVMRSLHDHTCSQYGCAFLFFFYCFFILFSSFLSYSNIWCFVHKNFLWNTVDIVYQISSNCSKFEVAMGSRPHCSCSAASNAPKDRKKERKERKRNNLISPLNLLKWSWCAMGRRVEGSKGCSKGREMQAHPYCTPIPCWIDRCEAERCGDVDSAKH